MRTRGLPRSTTLLVAALLAVLATTAILLFDSAGTKESERFVRQTSFVVWAVLLCVQSALWAVLAPSLWTSLRRLRAAYLTSHAVEVRIALSVAVILALATGFAVLYARLHPGLPLTHHLAKLGVLVAAGFFVMALAGIGIWLVEVACERLSEPGQGEPLGEYLRLRADLRRFLNTAALIIGTVTLSVGAERGALLDFDTRIDYPARDVLYYGAYYSLLLALIYVPAYGAFRGAGHMLLNGLLPLPDDRSTAWADWHADRKALEALLEIDVVTSRALQTAFAIAAPFLGSAIGLLLGGV